jgi:hypothetical protein
MLQIPFFSFTSFDRLKYIIILSEDESVGKSLVRWMIKTDERNLSHCSSNQIVGLRNILVIDISHSFLLIRHQWDSRCISAEIELQRLNMSNRNHSQQQKQKENVFIMF